MQPHSRSFSPWMDPRGGVSFGDICNIAMQCDAMPAAIAKMQCIRLLLVE